MVCLNSTVSPLISLTYWQFIQDGTTGFTYILKVLDLNEIRLAVKLVYYIWMETIIWKKYTDNKSNSGLGFFRKKPISSGTPGKKWKKPISSSFVRTKLEETGQNWKKLWKRSEMLEKLPYLITYKRLSWLWLQMHLVNWYCLKPWCKQSITFCLFLPVLSGQNWKKLDDNWGNLKRCHKCWKKLIIILIVSQKVIVSNASSWLQLFRNLI